jgi:hypothetical protein
MRQHESTWSLHTPYTHITWQQKCEIKWKITYWENSFYLYRFRKYMSYGFPIISFCNPGVHYEMPCIIDSKGISSGIRAVILIFIGTCITIWWSHFRNQLPCIWRDTAPVLALNAYSWTGCGGFYRDCPLHTWLVIVTSQCWLKFQYYLHKSLILKHPNTENFPHSKFEVFGAHGLCWFKTEKTIQVFFPFFPLPCILLTTCSKKDACV